MDTDAERSSRIKKIKHFKISNTEGARRAAWQRTDAVKADIEVIHIDHAHVTNRIGRRWFRGAERERCEQQTQRREHQHVC